jgi:lysophospholipase
MKKTTIRSRRIWFSLLVATHASLVATSTITAATPSIYNQVQEAYRKGIEGAQYTLCDDGKKLRYTQFQTPILENTSTLVFIQGRGTFLEYHEELISRLLIRGYTVWTYDLLGQGLSTHLVTDDPKDPYEYRKQYIDTFDTYLANLDHFIRNVVQPDQQQPFILGGYSTGAHILIRYLEEYSNTITGAFAISPILNYSTHFFVRQLVAMMAFLSPQQYTLGYGPEDPVFQTEFASNGYTSDAHGFEEIVDIIRVHPEQASVGGTTWGWVQASMDSCKTLKKPENLRKIETPLAIFSGLKDTIVDNAQNLEIMRTIPNLSYFAYPEGRHELFRESPPLRQEFWSDLDSFLESLTPSTQNATCTLPEEDVQYHDY